MGLAVGDALGTTLEFKAPGTFKPLTDLVGGGPFQLEPGQWTDDTSMALCLAESLIEKKGFDPVDQLKRYVRWYREGYLSSTGKCFDIGTTIRSALVHFEKTGAPYCEVDDPYAAGNGSIMRLAPVPMFYARDPEEAISRSEESSRTTHGARTCGDACRYFGALLVGALNGVDKENAIVRSLQPRSRLLGKPIHWERRSTKLPLGPSNTRIRRKSSARDTWSNPWKPPSGLFINSHSFKEGALLAVNLGNDADTTGAVYGQIAGAYYGYEGIPEEWRSQIALRDLIESFADRLYGLSIL